MPNTARRRLYTFVHILIQKWRITSRCNYTSVLTGLPGSPAQNAAGRYAWQPATAMSLLVRRPSFVQIVGTMNADQLVAAYQLAPHPKGGYYRDFV